MAITLPLVQRTPVHAQLRITASGMATQPRTTLLFSGLRESVAGVWGGGSVDVALGRFSVSASGLRGHVAAVDNSGALKRVAGEVEGRVRISAATWVALEGGYTIRAYNSAAGYQRWNMPAAGLMISTQLGDSALRTFVRGTYLPAVKVSGQPSPNFAFATEVGVTATPHRSPLFLQVSYRFERYDFPSSTRVEQFDAITVRAGVRFASR